LTGTPN